MWWVLACSPSILGIEFPLTLQGDGVRARVTSERGCQGSAVRVGLWGPGFGTEGDVIASVAEDEAGALWLNFTVQTGLGEAVAAMRVEGNLATVPLGQRPGEFELNLFQTELGEADFVQAAKQNAEQLAQEVEYWKTGRFLLVSDDGVAGEIRFRGDKGPIVSVHDAWWLTPSPVEASTQSSAAEILVGFEAEPSLQGEDALIRINVPSRTVVVPLGPVPLAEERKFRLEPGELSDADRRNAVQKSIMESELLERNFIEELAPRLSAAATTEEGACLQLPQLAEEWSMMLQGYDVELSPSPKGCSVGIESSRTQHGRRFRGVIEP